MKGRTLLHTLYLYCLVIVIFAWSSLPELSQYDLQLTGLLILVYFVFRQVRSSDQSRYNSKFLSAMILSAITLLLIFSTGSVHSPLFFLLDFLLFALSLLFEPIQGGAVALLLIGIFLWTDRTALDSNVLINVVALALTSPLAIVFGHSYLKSLENSGKIKILHQAIEKEELQSLLWVSKTAQPSLNTVLNSVSDLIIYFNSISGQAITIPADTVDKLKALENDLITLYTSADIFKDTIEKEASDIKEIQ